MGVITVEKCLFYLEVVDIATKLRTPGYYVDAKSYSRPGTRTEFQVKSKRIPFLGGVEKTVGYLHTDQIGSTGGRFKAGGADIRAIGTNLAALRAFFLGKGNWNHPKLIVADVPQEHFLMSGRDLGGYLVKIAKQGLRIPRELSPRLPTPRSFELWLPWDPTLPGKVPPKMSTTLRYATQVLDIPLISKLEDDLGYLNKGKALILGTGFRLRYFNVAPPDVHWVPQIENRVIDYLKAIGVKKPDEWYAIGRFDPMDDFPDLVDRFRGRPFQTYSRGVGLKPVEINAESSVTRRIFKTQARSPEEARNKIRAHLHRAAQNPATRKWAVNRALAWSRTSEKVVSRPAWEVVMKRKARLDEELYLAL